MKESEFIKLNFKFEISNFCTNVKVKITSLRTAVRQLANTLTVREFSKWIVCFMCIMIMPDNVIGIEIALWFVFWVAFLPGQARHLT
jgi:hypothetical protein